MLRLVVQGPECRGRWTKKEVTRAGHEILADRREVTRQVTRFRADRREVTRQVTRFRADEKEVTRLDKP